MIPFSGPEWGIFQGGGWGCIFWGPTRQEFYTPPPFYTPPTPRRVFSGVGGWACIKFGPVFLEGSQTRWNTESGTSPSKNWNLTGRLLRKEGKSIHRHRGDPPFFFFRVWSSMVYTLLSGPMVYTLFSCFPRKMVYHPAAKGVRQKEFGKKVTNKVTEASEKVTKKWPKESRKRRKVIELLLPTSFCGTLRTLSRPRCADTVKTHHDVAFHRNLVSMAGFFGFAISKRRDFPWLLYFGTQGFA